MDLLLDVDRWGMDHQLRPVLFVLVAPDELRVEIAVALLHLLIEPGRPALKGHAKGGLLLLDRERSVLGSGNVFARRHVVGQGFDSHLCVILRPFDVFEASMRPRVVPYPIRQTRLTNLTLQNRRQ